MDINRIGGKPTLSTLFPTRILTTELETYVSSSLYHRGRASKDSRLATSYTVHIREGVRIQVSDLMLGG